MPRPGSKPIYTVDTDWRILARLDHAPPAGYGRWTAPPPSSQLVDVSDEYIWRFLREQKIDLSGRKSWCETADPEFVAKAAEIVGLYLDPPEDAIVLAVDEKPSIQALEREQGYLKLANGRALGGRGHAYKRHGTSTLFAALEVLTGTSGRPLQASSAHRVPRLHELRCRGLSRPGIHVMLDNLSTHKPKRDAGSAPPRVRFHFTPTYSSWLNQIEIWFSILQGNSLATASFSGIQQLRAHIDDFVASYNTRAAPFVWTKPVVHHKSLKPRFSDL